MSEISRLAKERAEVEGDIVSSENLAKFFVNRINVEKRGLKILEEAIRKPGQGNSVGKPAARVLAANGISKKADAKEWLAAGISHLESELADSRTYKENALVKVERLIAQKKKLMAAMRTASKKGGSHTRRHRPRSRGTRRN